MSFSSTLIAMQKYLASLIHGEREREGASILPESMVSGGSVEFIVTGESAGSVFICLKRSACHTEF